MERLRKVFLVVSAPFVFLYELYQALFGDFFRV